MLKYKLEHKNSNIDFLEMWDSQIHQKIIIWYFDIWLFLYKQNHHLQERTRILLFGCLSITGIQTDMESSKSHGNTSAVPHQISRIIFMISSSVAVLGICICWDYLAGPHWLNVAITLVIQTRYNPDFYRFVAPAVCILGENKCHQMCRNSWFLTTSQLRTIQCWKSNMQRMFFSEEFHFCKWNGTGLWGLWDVQWII